MPKLWTGDTGFTSADVERAKLVKRVSKAKAGGSIDPPACLSEGSTLVNFIPASQGRASKPKFKDAKKYIEYCERKQAKENARAEDERRDAERVCPYTDVQLQIRLRGQENRENREQLKKVTRDEGIKPENMPLESRLSFRME